MDTRHIGVSVPVPPEALPVQGELGAVSEQLSEAVAGQLSVKDWERDRIPDVGQRVMSYPLSTVMG